MSLRDYQHASKAFVAGNFALAPRLKFQHHVLFSTLGGSNADLSILAVSADPPKFSVTNETANQYNKKNVIMTGITYQPITIKFFDDNSGISRKLWESYYAYTFGDHGAAKAGLYVKSLGPNFTSYGLENAPIIPFLNYVKIHTFAKRNWSGYTLVNPMITAWSTDTFNWSDTAPAQHTMTLMYDAVTYDSGSASLGNPPNFGAGSYDPMPSPLTSSTGSVNGGAVAAGAQQRKTDSTNAYNNPRAVSPTAATSINTYNNLKGLTLQGSGNSTNNAAIRNPQGTNQIGSTGLNNVAFPVYDRDNTSTAAVPRKIV
jgi:hypothetical protein